MPRPRRSAGQADPGLSRPALVVAALAAAGVVSLTGALIAGSAHAETPTPTPTSITVQPGGCGDTADGVSPFVRVRAVHPGGFRLVVQGEPVGQFADLVDTGFPVTPGPVRVDLIAEEGSGASGSTTVPACTTPGTGTPTPSPTASVTPTPGTTPTPGQASSTPTAARSTPTASTAAPAPEQTGGLAKTGTAR